MSDLGRRPRALTYTLDVVVAAAHARRDLRSVARWAVRRFDFRLLAAAAEETPSLPADGWHDSERLLKIQARTVGEELRLSIQAEGYEALRRVAGRGGRLTSLDGVLDVRFRFDPSGGAFAALKSSPEVRRALARLQLLLDEPGEA
jgi:hypothetical protein